MGSCEAVPKSNDQVRICIAYAKLNKGVRREVHPMTHVELSLAQLRTDSVFTVLDANSGFHHVPLSSEAKNLTTFITLFGRFAFNCLPFCLSPSPEL